MNILQNDSETNIEFFHKIKNASFKEIAIKLSCVKLNNSSLRSLK